MEPGSRSEQPLTALLLSDGRPGNYHLAEGVIAAAGRLRTVETVRLDIIRRQLVPNRLLALLAKCKVSPRTILQFGYGIDAAKVKKADFVASAGGDTTAANIAFSRYFGAPNYFCGSFRYFDPEDFALVFTSHAESARRPRHVRTLKPSPIDPDSLPPQPLSPTELPRLVGVLIGGDTSSIKFSDSDLDDLARYMSEMHARYGTKFYVSNSRRTPERISDRLATLAADPSGPIFRFIDVRVAGSGTLRDLYARSQAILCTADSSSMVSEAIWLRRPVIAITPQKCEMPENESEYRDYLESSGWTLTMPIEALTPELVLAKLATINPIVGNGFDSVAQALSKSDPSLFTKKAPVPRTSAST
jgi:uncharacterized protein